MGAETSRAEPERAETSGGQIRKGPKPLATIDLIIGVICKILATLFTFVDLQIAWNNSLFLTLQTTSAPDTRRDILMEHTGVIGRKKNRPSDLFCNLDCMPYTISACKMAPFTLQME